jgi:CRP/FNR family cyclic AMP-dependent transcriptional regulator
MGMTMASLFADFGLLDRMAEEPRTVKAGEVIFSVGDVASEFYVVRSGQVAVRLGNRTLDLLGEGEIFGEMALIDAGPRSASVVAETDCIIVPISEKQFLFMISEEPYFALSVMRVLVERLRHTNKAMPGS